jgi:putative endonuclease
VSGMIIALGHCERSEAIRGSWGAARRPWLATSRSALLAMTAWRRRPRIRHREARSAVAIQSRIPAIVCDAPFSIILGDEAPLCHHHGEPAQRNALRWRHFRIARRAAQHREGEIAGFTKRYGCKLLVWMEPHKRMDEAIAREKQIKSGSRKDKLVLIERDNPLWNDLYETLNA